MKACLTNTAESPFYLFNKKKYTMSNYNRLHIVESTQEENWVTSPQTTWLFSFYNRPTWFLLYGHNELLRLVKAAQMHFQTVNLVPKVTPDWNRIRDACVKVSNNTEHLKSEISEELWYQKRHIYKYFILIVLKLRYLDLFR